ncbi:MAG: nuclear transport factor 2 family protein [Planctomycetes bacterium]|nr:nuclear transport factor 2 family protein [Planctomycetota bacterium]MCW8136546.1 nuclear transport factor 2 family protein [Planctomycetota bacterium]
MTPEQVVQKQLDAYSACDLDAFAATYTDDVEVIDGAGKVICKGLAQLRERYGPVFKDNPNQLAVITYRITGGDWVIDDETVLGRKDGKTRRAVAIYRVQGDRIAHVRLISK